ncbi:CAP-Gly domain-containing linker protein 2-like isoform X6 [Manis pentadactyla]|uniref:CAP-Gly domain-containing linker protein 2-like isoform X6 n=1 Tax=Manis pentadactyla TaxID=143292 RepID=UPI00255CECAF|nr:CAP-Gly domain-containing linker protein 2-like isoform X6 [Manis pentadactyla]
MSTEDALRDALDQVQQVEKLMEAMRSCPDKAQAICNSRSASGIHQQDKAHKQEVFGSRRHHLRPNYLSPPPQSQHLANSHQSR